MKKLKQLYYRRVYRAVVTAINTDEAITNFMKIDKNPVGIIRPASTDHLFHSLNFALRRYY